MSPCPGPARSARCAVGRRALLPFGQRTEGQCPLPWACALRTVCLGVVSPASLLSASAVVCQNELGHFSVAGSLTSIFFCVLSIFFCVLNFSIIKVQI